jgi:hypothetical protein
VVNPEVVRPEVVSLKLMIKVVSMEVISLGGRGLERMLLSLSKLRKEIMAPVRVVKKTRNS